MSTLSPPANATSETAADSIGPIRPVSPHAGLPGWARAWWPLILGYTAILCSTCYRFASGGLWEQYGYDQGPMLIAAALWLVWRQRDDVLSASAPLRTPLWLWSVLAFFLLAYLVGVRIKMPYLEFGALLPVSAAVLWQIGGMVLVKRLWFALLILAFATPIPSPVIGAATMGLKEWVSHAAEVTLYAFGYPVARDGVILRLGPYNLLVADACSGLNSLVSLTAVGLLYVYLTANRRLAHALSLVLMVIPVAILTNVLRVLILMLITLYLGDEAGQGFLHDTAGFTVFFLALVLLYLIDHAIGRICPLPNRKDAHAQP